MKNLITCLVVCVLSGATFATTWTVDDDGKADFDNIQAALTAASDGDEIIVMPGIYTASGSNEVVYIYDDVYLHSSDGPATTIIDGEHSKRCFRIYAADLALTIEGFTIRNGYNDIGGAMHTFSSGPTLINNIFENNNSSAGGGLYIDGGCGCPTIIDCTFTNNNGGGAIWNSTPYPFTLINTVVCENAGDEIHGSWTDGGNNFVAESCVDDDGDYIPDEVDNCTLYNPDQADCNNNGIGDICDIADSTSPDCDQNSVPDECQPDCDGDGWIDPCDNDADWDGDGIPDNCEEDCNGNTIPDHWEIEMGWVNDCNENGIPDDCECPGDANQDGNANIADILVIIGYWGNNTWFADLNCDGIVDVSDLLVVIDNWGSCLPPIGACCHSQDCSIMTASDCSASGGTYLGDNTNCNGDPCPPGCSGNGLVDNYTATISSPCNGTTIPPSDISLALSLNSGCSVTGTANVYGETPAVTTTTWSHTSGMLTIGTFTAAVAESATTFETPLELIFPEVALVVRQNFEWLDEEEQIAIIANCGSPEAWVSDLEMTWTR